MNIGIVIDQLVSRDYSTLVLESFLSLLEKDEVTLYSLIHKPKRILGPIAQHRVLSSFLSKFINSKEDFDKSTFKKILAAGSLKISSEHEIVLYISSGWAELVQKPKNTKNILLKLDDGKTKGIKNYIDKKSDQSFDKRFSFLKLKGYEYLEPFHQVEDIKFDNKELKGVTLFSHENNSKWAENFKKVLLALNIPIIWLGLDGVNNDQEVFLKNPCTSEFSSLLNQSLFCVDLDSKGEPNYLLSLAAGRPILMDQSQKNLRTEMDGLLYADFNSVERINELIQSTLGKIKHFDSHQMHLMAFKNNARKFKRQLWVKIKEE